MKRLILALLLIPTLAFAATSVSTTNRGNAPAHTGLIRHLTHGTGTGTGTSYNLNSLLKNHTWQIFIEGTAPSPLKVELQGSIDDANWFTMDTYSTLTPENRMSWIVDHAVEYVRYDIITFTNGSTISIQSKHGGE